MKKRNVFILCIGAIIALMLTSCTINDNNISSKNIYTTVYPIKYLVTNILDLDANVYSIYPQDVDINEYEIPEKKFKQITNGFLFVYDGLTKEKNIAKDIIKANSGMLILDATSGITSINNESDLWLMPNNYLMLAKNIKNGIIENTDSLQDISIINENFNDIEEQLSLLDASLHMIASEAIVADKQTIVTSSDKFNYLIDYGFDVISLENIDILSESKLDIIKSNFKSKKYKNILTIEGEDVSSIVADLVKSYKAVVNEVNIFDNEGDYFNIMNNYLATLKSITS